MRYRRVMAPVVVPADVTVQYAGDVEASAVEADILAYMEQHRPGQEFVLAQLIQVLMSGNLLTDLVITEPAANVAVTAYQKITAGTIDVTQL